jgi:Tfp pilus assembly protein PilF
MRFQVLLLPLALIGPPGVAQDAAAAALDTSTLVAPVPMDEDILAVPKEYREFVLKIGVRYDSNMAKARELSRAFFSSAKEGGLGIAYDNDRTRTVAEVWRDRKANCISLTAMYVSACKILGIKATFADAPSISLWVRRGGLVYNERHMVAAIKADVVNVLIADFGGIPSYGILRVQPISESRFKALFHSNRSVEWIRVGDLDAALANAKASIADDPQSGIGWNVLGVVQLQTGDLAGAEVSFRTALSVDPANGAACGNLEDLFRRQGDEKQASKFRELGMKLRDRDPYFHAFLAREALASGQNDSAKEEIRRAIKLQGMDPEFYLVLAQVEVNQGERGAAVKAVEKAMHWSLPQQRKRMESKLALLQKPT